jgi:hypothetical protein
VSLIPDVVLAAGVILVGIPAATLLDTDTTLPQARVTDEASVRFHNNTTGVAMVRVNGRALWTDVQVAQVTDWAALPDSVATFTLMTSTTESDSATVTETLQSGGRYTLVGRKVDNNLELTIVRDSMP